MTGTQPHTWTSWSGLTTVRPRQRLTPRSAAEVADAVVAARAAGLRVKMRGSGHSFTDIAATDGILLDPTQLTGIVDVDRAAMTVTVLAGTLLHELNAALAGLGLALHNMGDIDRQTVAGAVSTGTHGTGGATSSLSGQLTAVELVTGAGEVVRAETGSDRFQAARVGLGAIGVLTSLTFRVEPAFLLDAVEQPTSWDEAVARHEELVAEHDHVDLYWFPHTDRCLVKTNDRTYDDAEPLPSWRSWLDDDFLANTVFGLVEKGCARWPSIVPRVNQVTSRVLTARRYRDRSDRVFVSPRRVVFREMEYAVPRAAGVEALTEVRRLIERSGWKVAWPVEVRATPPDEAWLSTTSGRDSTYLAFHVGRDTDHRPYFAGVERLLREYDGRPHWGKLHTRTADDLAPAYPHWADFRRVRDEVDPDRIFGNAYLERVLG